MVLESVRPPRTAACRWTACKQSWGALPTSQLLRRLWVGKRPQGWQSGGGVRGAPRGLARRIRMHAPAPESFFSGWTQPGTRSPDGGHPYTSFMTDGHPRQGHQSSVEMSCHHVTITSLISTRVTTLQHSASGTVLPVLEPECFLKTLHSTAVQVFRKRNIAQLAPHIGSFATNHASMQQSS